MAVSAVALLTLPIVPNAGVPELVKEINALTLFTRDMGKSCNFYACLGLRQTYVEPTFATFSVSGARQALNLQLRNASAPFRLPWGRPVIYVAGVDRMHARVVACGGRPEFPPRDAPWGERYFHVHDPAGHELAFAKPIRPSGGVVRALG